MDLLSLSSNRSSSNGSSDSGKEDENNDASNAKQDRSINNKYRASTIAKEEEDRISNLPVDIIHRILSFLDMIDVIYTSTLSKKWRHIWTSTPYLKFNSQMFHTLPEFAKFVRHVLSHRNRQTNVSSVKLYFTGLACQFAPVVNVITQKKINRNRVIVGKCKSLKFKFKKVKGWTLIM